MLFLLNQFRDLLTGNLWKLNKKDSNIFLKKFPSISVALGDPFARVDAPAFLAPVIKELSPNFAAALGSALKGIEEG